jgi:hypothetical protein
MNEARLSPSTRKLLETARTDGPSAASRARMWAGMSSVLGGAVGAATTTTVSVIHGGASGTKLLSIASLFGGTLTVGIAALLLTLRPAIHSPKPAATAPPAMGQSSLAIMPQSAIREPPAAPGQAKPSHSAGHFAKPLPAPSWVKKNGLGEDSLAHEASLVSEARNALAHGNPELALRAIRAARALRSHQLVPEELAVEEQALRALGHSDEANGIDVQIRLQYPASALAR